MKKLKESFKGLEDVPENVNYFYEGNFYEMYDSDWDNSDVYYIWDDKPEQEEPAKPTRPPKGIIPKFVWKSQRADDLVCAIARYIQCNSKPNVDWREELRGLLNELNGGKDD